MKSKSEVPAVTRRYISRRELAAYIGCSLQNIKHLIKQGAIPEYDVSPNVKRYRIEDVEAFMASKLKKVKS